MGTSARPRASSSRSSGRQPTRRRASRACASAWTSTCWSRRRWRGRCRPPGARSALTRFAASEIRWSYSLCPERPTTRMNSVPALSELFADWYWEMDGQLRLTYSSHEFALKTGLDPAEDYWEHNRKQLERHESFRDFEIQRFGAGGRSVCLALSGEPVFDDDIFLGYRGVGRNITAQKRGDQLLRLAHAGGRGLAAGA